MPPDAPPEHSRAFRFRRFLNWFPMGLAYAFLYMGRYNLTVAKNELGDLMTKEDFGVIFGVGTVTYAFAFLINGPLTDKLGGKRGILIATLGSGLMNLIMGLFTRSMMGSGDPEAVNLRLVFSLLYAANMYFQSFGAVSIVKVNAHWFHVRERGGFSGIFGTMISSGIFFAFTVNPWILGLTETIWDARAPWWVFFAPAGILWMMFAVELFLLKDRPGEAGLEDFDTGDASSGEEDGPSSLLSVIRKIVTNPIILTVAFIEFCTGVIRNGVMHWFPIYAKEVWALPAKHFLRHGDWGAAITIVPFFVVAGVVFGLAVVRGRQGKRSGLLWSLGGVLAMIPFLQGGWGGLLFVAGVAGANIAGWVSDLFFGSRRAPVAGLLYLMLAVACVGMFLSMSPATTQVGWVDEEKETVLKEGDQVVAIAGVSDPEDWRSIVKAVRCLPATCVGDSRWDVEKCTCSTGEVKPVEGLKVSDGTIPATLVRDGKRMEVKLKDGKPTMKAGDTRSIAAGPKLPISPIWLGIVLFLVSLGVIGTHGLLSGTATMDFGGRKGAATAVGMIDGFVYLGTGVQSFSLGYLTTANWAYWPWFLLPFAILGVVLLRRIWHAIPEGKGGGH